VIALGLRLAVGGGREAATRLAVVVIAVGVGTGMLLATLAMMNAVGAWNNRHAWFWTGSERLPAPAPGIAPLWWQTGRDFYDGQDISRFDLAATGPTSPVPPGLPRDPGPGTRPVLCLPGTGRADQEHSCQPARRPLPRATRGHHREHRAALA
jgi:hypothetical protein